jgi:5-hydroxyisourate hydrolase-like protein (transthyretin family)
VNNALAWRGASAHAPRTVLATSALVVVVLLSLLSTSSALAVGSGSITGTVVDDADQTPIAGIRVCAEMVGGFEAEICDLTEVDGGYAIPGLSAGSYRVGFSVPLGSEANYVGEYYDGKSSWFEADPVAVAEGATKSGIDAELQAGGRITGEVVAAAGGAPLESIEVCASATVGAGAPVGCVETDGDGKYAITSLPGGSYKVRFAPGFGEVSAGEFGRLNYVTQYYSGKAGQAQADAVTAAAGLTTPGIDAEMAVGGVVSGLVSDAVSGDPIEGVQVCPHQGSEEDLAGCDYTGGDGRYSISGLATGSYKLGFTPSFGDQVHAGQYYQGKATLAAADSLAVTQGATTSGIDAELLELGGIAGEVTAASGGAPVSGIEVCATWVGGAGTLDFGCDVTGAGGDYRIQGLKEGPYRVEFKGGPDYVTQYYNGKALGSNTDPVPVTNATTTGSIDARLQLAGRISGKVVDASSKTALQNISVCAQAPSGVPASGSGACVVTGADGKYTIGGLAAGSYPVRFSVPYFNIVNYLAQFYDGHAREGEANSVSVVAGATTPSIDAEMHPGGMIEGKVVDATGQAALQGVDVCATPVSVRRSAAGNYPFGNCDSTDAGGEYSIERLPTGTYKVRFSPGFSLHGYMSQYSDGKATKKLADPVAVTAGAATDGIDAEMHKGGKIEGTVLDAVTKAPLQWINVCLRGNFESCVATDPDGKFTIEGLASGSYKIGFFSSFQARGYIGQYYDGKATRDAANPISVSAGESTAGIDAEMEVAGEIAGTVTDALSGLGADSVQACAYEAGSGDYVGCDNTEANGEYAIEGLASGSYKVKFSPGNEFGGIGQPQPNYNYVSHYYNGKATRDTADAVPVTAGEAVPDIDTAMHEGGQIEGRVIDASTKAPVRYTAACVYDPDEGGYFRCGFTDADGNYTIEGLASGSYKVRFSPNQGYEGEQSSYLPQFYDDEPAESAATAVAVAAPSAHIGIDAELHAGGQIKGRVTAASDGAPLPFVFVCVLEPSGEEEPLRCAETNGDGRYAISGLATGSYKVSFEALNYEEGPEEAVAEEEFATQYYDSKSSRANAILVPVTAGGPAVTSIDAEMVEGPAGPEPEGSGESAGGGSAVGGSSVSVVPPPVQPVPPAPPRSPVKPVKCKKGFQKKKVHGRSKCVKPRKHSGKRR